MRDHPDWRYRMSPANSSIVRATVRHRRLSFEILECRTMLSVTVDLASRAAMLSSADESITANGGSDFNGKLSADGRYVVFGSAATNLVSGINYYPGMWN